MNDDTKKKEQGGSEGVLLFFLLIGALILWVKSKETTESAAVLNVAAGGNGSGSTVADTPLVIEAAAETVDNIVDNTIENASPLGVSTALKDNSAAGTTEAERLAYVAKTYGIDTSNLGYVALKEIRNGSIKASTLKNIANYQAVQAGTMSWSEYDPSTAAAIGTSAAESTGLAYVSSKGLITSVAQLEARKDYQSLVASGYLHADNNIYLNSLKGTASAVNTAQNTTKSYSKALSTPSSLFTSLVNANTSSGSNKSGGLGSVVKSAAKSVALPSVVAAKTPAGQKATVAKDVSRIISSLPKKK
jgi:hypothetical protein